MTFSEALTDARYRLAANVRHHRLAQGLTRDCLAKDRLLYQRLLELTEDPSGPNLSLSSIVKLARALDLDITDLFVRRELPELKRGPKPKPRRQP